MAKLTDLISKNRKKVLGILSGTSVDAVDVVLLDISGSGIESSVEVIDYQSFKIDKELKEYIVESSYKETGSVRDICLLNSIIAVNFAKCINEFLSSRGISSKEIDLIGSHGQTVHHIPFSEEFATFGTKSTLQIGDPSIIANITGITTVGDFRSAAIGAGGSGAPLVP